MPKVRQEINPEWCYEKGVILKILIACEESQTVLHEFLIRGHDVWSCDLQETSGNYPERHIQGDVLDILDDGWDMMVGHPICTRMANSGYQWLKDNPERWADLDKDVEFFLKLWNADIPMIALENSQPHFEAIKRLGVTYTQKIQPYNFGVPETKGTCLWLKNLPPLMFTIDAREQMLSLPKKETQRIFYMSPGKDRGKMRSKTFQPIAEQFAEQWG